MTRGHPQRALVVAAVGFLGLDAILLVLAGVWSDRAGLIFWGVLLALLAVVPVVLWRRYMRQMDDVHEARQAMAREFRHLQRELRERSPDAVPGETPRR